MMRNKELTEKAYELGFKYEKNHHGCAQCVVAAVLDTFGLKNDDIFKTMTGFGGGGGGLCNSGCGAYAGGIAILSWFSGRERSQFNDEDDEEVRSFHEKYRTYNLVNKLHKKFIDRYGCIICRDIHMKIFGRTFYTPDPNESKKFQENGAYDTKCTDVVGTAAKWVTEIIIEEKLISDQKKF